MFFPARNTAAYSDILLGAAPPYWLFRLIGFLPDTAFQLWMLSLGIMNFLVTYLTMRRAFGLSKLASAGGAYLFAFAAMRANQMGHQQLLPQFFSMLAVYCLAMIVREIHAGEPANRVKTRRWMALLVASVVLQLFAGFYLGYFLCLGLATVLIVALFVREGWDTIVAVVKRDAVAIALALVIAAVPLTWMGYHYLQAQRQVGSRPFASVRTMVPTATSLMYMGQESWLYGWTRPYLHASRLRMEGEHKLGLGLVTPVIIGIGLFRMARKKWGLIAVVATLVIGLAVFTYPWSIVPWWVVYKVVPGANAIRALSRISLLLLIAFSFGLAFALNSFKSRSMALALLVLVCLEQGVTTPSYSKQRIRSDVSVLVSQVPKGFRGFYYAPCLVTNVNSGPWDGLPYKQQLDAMFASLDTGVPTVNGYSGGQPPAWSGLEKVPIRSESDEERMSDTMDRWLRSQGLETDAVAVVGNRSCCKEGFRRYNCAAVHPAFSPEPESPPSENWPGH